MSSSVAAVLRGERHAQHLSLDELSRRCGVAPSHLDALERGHYAAFGGRVPAKASLRAAAKALGLDAEPLLLALDEQWPPGSPPPGAPTEAMSQVPPPPVPRPEPAPQSAPEHEELFSDEPSGRRPARWLLWVALVIAVLAVAGWALAQRAGDPANAVALDSFAHQPALEPLPTATAHTGEGPGGLPGTIVAGAPLMSSVAAPGDVQVQILNASGDPAALDDAVTLLLDLGYDVVSSATARQTHARGAVYFNDGWEGEARALLDTAPGFGSALPNDLDLDPDLALHVIIGQDWEGGSA